MDSGIELFKTLPIWMKVVVCILAGLLAWYVFLVLRAPFTIKMSPEGDCRFLWKDDPVYIEYCK